MQKKDIREISITNQGYALSEVHRKIILASTRGRLFYFFWA